jgi:thymidine kinase
LRLVFRQQSTAKACTMLAEARAEAEDFEVIGIDEGQFFGKARA